MPGTDTSVCTKVHRHVIIVHIGLNGLRVVGHDNHAAELECNYYCATCIVGETTDRTRSFTT